MDASLTAPDFAGVRASHDSAITSIRSLGCGVLIALTFGCGGASGDSDATKGGAGGSAGIINDAAASGDSGDASASLAGHGGEDGAKEPSNGGTGDDTSSAGAPAGKAGALDTTAGPRLVLGVQPPLNAGSFRLSSAGIVVQRRSCVGKLCVRGFPGRR